MEENNINSIESRKKLLERGRSLHADMLKMIEQGSIDGMCEHIKLWAQFIEDVLALYASEDMIFRQWAQYYSKAGKRPAPKKEHGQAKPYQRENLRKARAALAEKRERSRNNETQKINTTENS